MGAKKAAVGGSPQIGRDSSTLVRRALMCFVSIILLLITRWYVAGESRLERFGEQEMHTLERDSEGLTEPWNTITPDEDLVFHDCFGHHQCARLSVPMDWNSTDISGPRVNLAITKLPAKVPITDPRYGGLLWLQPGGPGSSGVNFLLNQGKTVQTIIDSPLDPSDDDYDEENPPKYYDIVGVDPRGVNNTTPRLLCFPDATTRDAWIVQSASEGVIGSSDTSFANLWARSTALSEGCSRRLAESERPEDKLAFHMNSSPVVADIVAVVEKYGKWREEEATRLLYGNGVANVGQRLLSPYSTSSQISKTHEEAWERARWKKGEETLLYWGLSYGTILGATLAAMQPHRIERAVIDGVGDALDYYRGEWLTNLQDTDILLEKFSGYCYKAGPDKCTLYTPGGPSTIEQRFKETVESLKGNPVGVPAQGTLAPDLIIYSEVKAALSQAVYAPIQFFPTIATLISDLSNHNGTSFALAKQANPPFQPQPNHCANAAPYAPECVGPANLQGETSTAILCTDGNGSFGMSKENYAEYATGLRNQSWVLGETWAQIRMGCVGWGIRPKWRFPGPFTGETKKGMLIVGNVHDPVTPVRNADAMAKRFPGSVVLTQDAEGHCIFSSPSLCMARYIRTYFQNGTLPDPGTICDGNEKPFLGVTKRAEPGEGELLEQLRWTARHFIS